MIHKIKNLILKTAEVRLQGHVLTILNYAQWRQKLLRSKTKPAQALCDLFEKEMKDTIAAYKDKSRHAGNAEKGGVNLT